MAYKIEITDTAFNDLDEILNYIANTLNNTTAAKKLLNEFKSELENVALFPFAMAKLKNSKKEYRKFFVGNYIVIYKVDGDIISILTIRYAPMKLGDDI